MVHTPKHLKFNHVPGHKLTGVEAQIADMQDCEPYALSTIDISEIYFGTTFDPRIGNNEKEALANAARLVACWNFFHGRDIPTENIPEGGFWELVDLLQQFTKGGDVHYEQEHARALLTKMGIEQ